MALSDVGQCRYVGIHGEWTTGRTSERQRKFDKRFTQERQSTGVGSIRLSGGNSGFLWWCCWLYNLTDKHYESEHEGQR